MCRIDSRPMIHSLNGKPLDTSNALFGLLNILSGIAVRALDWGGKERSLARPHPGPLPQERGNLSPHAARTDRAWLSQHFIRGNHPTRERQEKRRHFHQTPACSPSPGGEGRGEGERFLLPQSNSDDSDFAFHLDPYRSARIPLRQDSMRENGLDRAKSRSHARSNGPIRPQLT